MALVLVIGSKDHSASISDVKQLSNSDWTGSTLKNLTQHSPDIFSGSSSQPLPTPNFRMNLHSRPLPRQ
ncbi:hypothetical protein L873DRAFT_1798359 [Choiromyces venosus 120613-1]|uniref:Uncharacterized protein n=1 Tax=Choiromyces venosus 120613-1 TaxID=1336337 RepID=A0A3N4K325_9PEZI|nr:hypothetical protein L873DRAFT_1798359 [Choiromyces venosus 120613-1]